MRDLTLWSVRFAVEDAVSREITGVPGVRLPPGLRQLAFSEEHRDDESDDLSAITFELSAVDRRSARIRALHLLGQAKEAAGLPAEPSPVVWVTPLADDVESSHRFLEAAEELMEADRFDLAVVAAQIHLEVHVATLVERAMTTDPSRDAKAAVDRHRGWAPHNKATQPLLQALLDRRVTEFTRWDEYRAHVSRRNDVVHRGQSIDPESARASIEVVGEFWMWLADLAAAATEMGDDATAPR